MKQKIPQQELPERKNRSNLIRIKINPEDFEKVNSHFEVLSRHSFVEWLFGFKSEERADAVPKLYIRISQTRYSN